MPFDKTFGVDLGTSMVKIYSCQQGDRSVSDVFIIAPNKTFPEFRIPVFMLVLHRLNAQFLVVRNKNLLVNKRYFFFPIIVFFR